jgi:hypothetical protein
MDTNDSNAYPNGSSSPVPQLIPTATGTSTKPNWFGAIMGLLTPQQAAATAIRTDDPISAKQQQTNNYLFVAAMLLVLVLTGAAVVYFLKK